jgi:nitrogen regulatory protein P-II 2
MNHSLKKVTVVAERLLKDPLVKILRAEGATGFTLIAVEGEGSRGIHASDWEGRNIQLETIVAPDVADRILDRIGAEFLENYAVIAYLTDVSVLRRGKFAKESADAPPKDEAPDPN